MTGNQSFKFHKTVPVNTYDCDFLANWKPTAFVQAMSQAAADHAEGLGEGIQSIHEKGYYWVLSRLKVKFLKYPHPGDQVHLRTWPKTIQQKLFFIRDFELFDRSGEPVALATSAWLIIDARSRRLIPPAALEGINMPLSPDQSALDEALEKINLPEGGEIRLQQKAAYSAIDIVGHVNNTRYVEALCDSIDFSVHRGYVFDWMQINFDKEVRPEEEVVIKQSVLDEHGSKLGFLGFNLSRQTDAFKAVVGLRPRSA